MTDVQIPAFVSDWKATLKPARLDELVPDPSVAGIFSADMINGFAHFGPLASERVSGIIDPLVTLCHRAWDHGITHFTFFQDTHSEHAPEFAAYPPHALRGTDQSAMIPELMALPFSDRLTIFEKNSLHPALGNDFDDYWDEEFDDLRTAIVVGNCTDLCVYSLAMHLRLRANALNIHGFEVVVPVSSVQTFDIPVDPAQPGVGHPGDFFHDVFLYHMASNGIRIVSDITFADGLPITGVQTQ